MTVEQLIARLRELDPLFPVADQDGCDITVVAIGDDREPYVVLGR